MALQNKLNIFGFNLNLTKNTYNKDYLFQAFISFNSLLISGINYYFLSKIDFNIIGFFAFQETVSTLIISTTGNFFAFSATRKKNNEKFIAPLIILQIISIFYIFFISSLAKIALEGNFNIQLTFSLPLICLIGIRRTFYCLKINTSLGKKNYILTIINLSENLVFLILLLILKFNILNNKIDLINNNLTDILIIFKAFSNLIPIILSIYYTFKFLKQIRISWLFLRAKSTLLFFKAIKFVPFKFTRKFITYFGILLTSFIDGNLLSLVAIANKAIYPQILLDGIIRKSSINKIRKEIPKGNKKGKKLFLISTIIGVLSCPLFILIVNNSQTYNFSEFIIYYLLLSLSISIRGLSWFSNSIVAKYSVRLGYFASILGLTQPLFLAIFYKLPFNLSILRCLGISLVFTSIVIIYYWNIVKRNLIARYNIDN
mgnify:CR=1 FL=1